MNRFAMTPAVLVAVAMLAAGCSSSSSSPTPPPPPLPEPELPVVRFVHAVPDAPNVNVAGATSVLAGDLAFGEATSLLTLQPGTVNVRVDGIVPGGEVTVIGPVDLTLESDTVYSVVALGQVSPGSPLPIGALVLAEPRTEIPAGQVRVQVVHAAPQVMEVDVHVTAPDTELSSETVLGSFGFGEDLGPVDVAAGVYRIRVTPAGTTTPVVFDSGEVELPAGAGLLVVAVENTGPQGAPVSLLVSDGVGSFPILDVDTPAEVRVIHASSEAPPVNVYVDDALVLEDVPFTAFSDYIPLPAGTYNVVVTPADNPGVSVIDVDLTVEAGVQYSVYAAGTLAELAPYVLVDDNRRIATESRVRLIHLSPLAELVDIYVLGDVGTDISTVAPTFAGVDFLDETGYVSLAGGNYEVTVAIADTATAAIGPVTISVLDGGIYTAAARESEGGVPPFGLILLDDFND